MVESIARMHYIDDDNDDDQVQSACLFVILGRNNNKICKKTSSQINKFRIFILIQTISFFVHSFTVHSHIGQWTFEFDSVLDWYRLTLSHIYYSTSGERVGRTNLYLFVRDIVPFTWHLKRLFDDSSPNQPCTLQIRCLMLTADHFETIFIFYKRQHNR